MTSIDWHLGKVFFYHAYLYGYSLSPLVGARCDVQMTPSPMSASLGEIIILNCQGSQDISSYLSWYQQKPVRTIKLLIYSTFKLDSGVPSRFSGSGSGSDYPLTINSLESEDVAIYYCLQYASSPPTVIQITT